MEATEFKEGEFYHIDKNFRTGGKVRFIKSYGNHYCLVEDPDSKERWETMMNRLSEWVEPQPTRTAEEKEELKKRFDYDYRDLDSSYTDSIFNYFWLLWGYKSKEAEERIKELERQVIAEEWNVREAHNKAVQQCIDTVSDECPGFIYEVVKRDVFTSPRKAKILIYMEDPDVIRYFVRPFVIVICTIAFAVYLVISIKEEDFAYRIFTSILSGLFLGYALILYINCQ